MEAQTVAHAGSAWGRRDKEAFLTKAVDVKPP